MSLKLQREIEECRHEVAELRASVAAQSARYEELAKTLEQVIRHRTAQDVVMGTAHDPINVPPIPAFAVHELGLDK